MKALLIGMAIWMFVANASAFYEKTTTSWYTKKNPGNDPFVVHLLNKMENGWAVMVNEGKIRKKNYAMASPIVSEQGMSYYDLVRLRKVDGEWERGDCALMMCDVVGKELRHSDERFVNVQNVSLGVASSIFKSWGKMSSSGDYAELLPLEFTSGYQKGNRKEIFFGHLNNKEKHPRLRRISLTETLRYSIHIGYNNLEWSISCDIIDGKVKYLNICEVCL